MKERSENITRKLPAALALILIVLVWELICVTGVVPAYMLPSPVAVVKAFFGDFPNLMFHAATTLQETAWGLLAGILLAIGAATAMDRFTILERAFYPLMIITQTIPTIAIAPLLVLWMGFGMAPKITLVVITTFFPITVGLLDGYQSVDEDALRLMRSMGASRLQIFYHVKFPSALPFFFSGLKISASYAVVGAVISEWLGGFEGLGVYMTRAKKAYAFDRMFAVIFLIVIISLLLMKLVQILRDLCIPWAAGGGEPVRKRDAARVKNIWTKRREDPDQISVFSASPAGMRRSFKMPAGGSRRQNDTGKGAHT